MIALLIALSLTSVHAELSRGDDRPEAYLHHGFIISIKPLRFDDGHVTYSLSAKVTKDPRNHKVLGASKDQRIDLYFGDADVDAVERTNVEGVR